MIELNITFFIQMVNFLILLAILNLVIYRPIRGIIKQRAERMASDLTAIEDFAERAEKKISDYQAALNQARQEGVTLRNKIREEALAEEKNIVGEASRQANEQYEAAKKEIEGQSAQVREVLSQQVKDFAKLVADKILVH